MIERAEDISQIKTVKQKLSALPIMEAFYTLQGEGFHQGKAAYFIRLGGCDVGCFWCDVKESWDASVHSKKTIDEIVEMMNCKFQISNCKLSNSPLTAHRSPLPTQNLKLKTHNSLLTTSKPIIVITGGEPLLYNLNELTYTLQQQNFKTHIETSGSSPFSGFWNWVCLSPKKFKKPLPEAFKVADELKVVVYNKSDFKWAEENAAQVSSSCKLYLQPEWSKANELTPLIIEYIKQNPQWQLSLQVHKYLNIP